MSSCRLPPSVPTARASSPWSDWVPCHQRFLGSPCVSCPTVYPDGRVCISILHAPGDDPMGYESSAERWSPVQSVEKILLSVVSMLAGNTAPPSQDNGSSGPEKRPDARACFSFFTNPCLAAHWSSLSVGVQSLSRVRLFPTPWTAACQAALSITRSQNLLRLMSIESMMPSDHLILCRPLLLFSIFPSIRVFSNVSTLRVRWPKYWGFSFSINPSNEYSGLISFRSD